MGELIKTDEVATDMEGYITWLEKLNNGPLTLPVEIQTELQMDDHACSNFDLHEVGAVHDVATFIDA